MSQSNTESTGYTKLSWRGMALIFFVLALGVPVFATDILSLRPNEDNFKQALNGFIEELNGELQYVDMTLDQVIDVNSLAASIESTKPKMILLLEGKSVGLYKKYQNSMPADSVFPPALVMMTIFAEKRMAGLKNTMCIKYEIQGVHSLCSVRGLLDQPFKRIGVLYSTTLRLFYQEQKQLCLTEEIELVGIMIDQTRCKVDKDISRSLRKLVRKEKVDAIWILNDSLIMRDTHLEWAWLPQLKKLDVPVVVSLERWVSEMSFGHFAVVPDHFEMGIQAARAALELREDSWSLASFEAVRSPYSAHKKLNTKHLPKNISLRTDVLTDEWFDYSNAQALVDNLAKPVNRP